MEASAAPDQDERHFELRAEYAKDFNGATMAYGAAGETVNIGSRLENGNGTISTKDGLLANAFAGHPALKEVSAPSAKSSSSTSSKESK
jgi:hypothetical protein